MKIMIVDDHVDMRRLIISMVKRVSNQHNEFIECDRGESASTMYLENQPDCVLMDIELKSMSGFQVTEEIFEEDKEAKIVFVTSYDTPTFQRKAKQLNALGFVTKDNLQQLNHILSTITTK